MLAELGAIFDEPLHAALETRQFVDRLGIEGFHREQRNQSDHRAHCERAALAVGQAEHVVKKPILIIPELDVFAAKVVHRAANIDEVLEEFARDILVNGIIFRQLQRDGEHVEAVHAHPTGAVRLLDVAAGGQGGAPVEDPDVIEAEKAALKYVAPVRVLTIDPPSKIEQKLLKDALEKFAVTDAAPFHFHFVDAPG